MRRARIALMSVMLLGSLSAVVRAGDLDTLLEEYRARGVQFFDAGAGVALWRRDFGGKSCASCHTDSPRNPGRHDGTGEPIDPMAPSVNPGRLTEIRQMKKWLLRNCKSTLGRECTPQEKGDVLTWLREQ